jgi:hypothetical protein
MRILPVILLVLSSEHLGAEPVRVQREALDGPDRVHGEVTIEAPLDVILAGLQTPCAVQAWMPGADAIRVLERRGPVTEVHMRSKLPWPWRDRVARLIFKRRRDGAQTVIDMTNADTESDDDAVVVPFSRARWTLTPEGNSVHLTLSQRFTPGGTVPQWLADQMAESRVVDALDNLESLVESRRDLDDCDWLPSPRERGSDQPAGVP